jgi:ketosteroid isomerase-like protein
MASKTSPCVDAANRFYAALRALDTEALLSVLAPAFVAKVSAGMPGGFGGTYHGGAEMLQECWTPIFRTFGCIPYPDRLCAADDGTVIAFGGYRGTVPSTGRALHAAFAHRFCTRDGLITELEQVTDTGAWAASASQVDVARAVFDAVRARDGDALLAAYADDIVIVDDRGLPYGGEFHGREGAIAHSLGFVQTWDQYQDDADRDPEEVLIDAGATVVALWRLRARAGGHRLDQATVSVMAVSEGVVTRLEMFHQDTAAVNTFLDAAAAARAGASS